MEPKDIKYLPNCIKPLLPVCLDNCFTEAEQIAKINYAVNCIIHDVNDLPEILKKYIQENFKSYILGAMYNPENETLTLYIKEEEN